MACIEPDGSLTLTGQRLLQEIAENPMTPQEIASTLEEPIFKMRARIREMVEADLIEEKDGEYSATEKGKGMV